MGHGRHSRRRLGAGLALLLVVGSAAPTPAAAAAPDPPLEQLGGWTWPPGFTGTWRFGSFPTTSWMRTAVTSAVNAASHTRYRNPDFESTTSASANVTVEYKDSSLSENYCTPGIYNWVGCAKTGISAPFMTWQVWLASNRCWTNGAGGRTCASDTGAFDLQTVTLNEMGHVNVLAHHVNPAYADAVVQADPVPYPNTNWQMRTFRWADGGGLSLLYGSDPCTTPPCPLGAGS
ncbi:MAG: hypothetical protein K2X91_15675 [Thermoleophilia bacterium]|nr:hypothetical protein [Thermoleophilia bacterium]